MEELEIQPQSTTPEPEPEPESEAPEESGHALPQTVSIEEWMASSEPGVEEAAQVESLEDVQLLAVLEACVYVAEEPLMPAQIAAALNQDPERIRDLLEQLVTEFDRPEHGVSIKEVAGGYKMATKPEHHDAVRNYVKSLKAPLKLSLPALETLAVIAYKQPVTTPEIMEIRGVQGGGVLKMLLDRKLITEAGRKNVIGKPILYKTTKEFLIQFGLKDLAELPSLKEFEEIRRMAMSDSEIPAETSAGEQDVSAGIPHLVGTPDAAAAVDQADGAGTGPPAAVSDAPTGAGEPEDAAPEVAAPTTDPEVAAAEADAQAAESEAATFESDAPAGEVEDSTPVVAPPAPESQTEEPAVEIEAAAPSAAPDSEAVSAGSEAPTPDPTPPTESQEH